VPGLSGLPGGGVPAGRGVTCRAGSIGTARVTAWRFVMVTGLGARDAHRLALASMFGADLVVDVSAVDPVVELTKATGALADVAVDVTVRAPAAFAQAMALARPAGTVVVAGTRGLGSSAPGF
jgi:alcohol dehydrogenase